MFPEEDNRTGIVEPLLLRESGETMTAAALIDSLSVFEESKSQSDSVLEERENVEVDLDFELFSEESNSETDYTPFDYSNESIQYCMDKNHLYNKIKGRMYGEY